MWKRRRVQWQRILVTALCFVILLESNFSGAGINIAPVQAYAAVDATIRESMEESLYNAEYYAKANEDVAVALGYDDEAMYNHWINYGKAEGRNASMVFNAKYYLEVNPDVAAVVGEDYVAAYEHFVNTGLLEGRESSPVFNVKYYLWANQDVAQNFNGDYVSAAKHFNENAIAEGRSGSGNFDYTVYRACNTDVEDLYGDYTEGYYIHYINHGRAEGRTSGLAGGNTGDSAVIDRNAASYRIFDKEFYLEQYPELVQIVGQDADALYLYWLEQGIAQGQTASPVIVPKEYLELNADVAEVFGDDFTAALRHFLSDGIFEGRTGSREFDYTIYAYCNTDVAKEFKEDYVGYYWHYINHGKAENRTAAVFIPEAQPTATPIPTATPEPTATPVPTATPEPTVTPVPTATPEPTTTPELTVTPIPEENGKVYLHKDSNVDTINAITAGAMPCIGEAKVLVFYVDFKNGETNWTKSVQEVEDMFFSEEGKYDSTLAYSEKDSLRSYYYRSSYGKVDITGDVYEYETKYDTTYYTYPKLVLDEIFSHYDESINWDDYDGNNDGYVDGVYLIARNTHVFGGANHVASYHETYENKKIAQYCFLFSRDFSTLCHETCHMFGLPDMYEYSGVNPSGLDTACIMHNGLGDLPGATKYVYGWLDGVKFVDSNATIQLRSYTNYGDALVIYPNGDSTNRNWFIVEYVTGEGNNPEGGNGLRVWKTQMNLDEKKNIVGLNEFYLANRTSPYEYLEAVHPDDVWNYYMSVGESITPYTYPSTAYSDVFNVEGGVKTLKELTFSGIYIEFLEAKDGVAEVKVTIAETLEETDDVNSELTIWVSDDSCAFLDSTERYLLATATFDSEIKVTGEAMLVSEDKLKEIPLYYTLSKQNNSFSLFIEASNFNVLDAKKYTIAYPDIATYYGKRLSFEDTAEVTLPELPVPYQQVSENFSTGIPCAQFDCMKSFRMSDEKLLTIALNEVQRTLYWNEIDLKSNQAVTEELELPQDLDKGKTICELSIWTDEEYYYVRYNEYICCYKDKELISYLDTFEATQESLMFCGSNQNSFFFGEDSKQFYRLHNNGESIGLQSMEVFEGHAETEEMQEIKAPINNRKVYSLGEEVYLIDTSDFLYYVTKDHILHYQFNNKHVDGSSSIRDVKLVDDKLYVIDGGGDLMMHVFDSNFNLIESKVLLTGLDDAVWRPLSLEVELIEDAWVVSFESGSNINKSTFASTYIAVFDLEGNSMNYYRYGDGSFRYVCEVIPISKDDLVCVDMYFFFHIAPLNGEDDVE